MGSYQTGSGILILEFIESYLVLAKLELDFLFHDPDLERTDSNSILQNYKKTDSASWSRNLESGFWNRNPVLVNRWIWMLEVQLISVTCMHMHSITLNKIYNQYQNITISHRVQPEGGFKNHKGNRIFQNPVPFLLPEPDYFFLHSGYDQSGTEILFSCSGSGLTGTKNWISTDIRLEFIFLTNYFIPKVYN